MHLLQPSSGADGAHKLAVPVHCSTDIGALSLATARGALHGDAQAQQGVQRGTVHGGRVVGGALGPCTHVSRARAASTYHRHERDRDVGSCTHQHKRQVAPPRCSATANNAQRSRSTCVACCCQTAPPGRTPRAEHAAAIAALSPMHDDARVAPRHRGRLWRAVATLYSSTRACVSCNGVQSRFFATSLGVAQGCPLSPILVSIYLHIYIYLCIHV